MACWAQLVSEARLSGSGHSRSGGRSPGRRPPTIARLDGVATKRDTSLGRQGCATARLSWRKGPSVVGRLLARGSSSFDRCLRSTARAAALSPRCTAPPGPADRPPASQPRLGGAASSRLGGFLGRSRFTTAVQERRVREELRCARCQQHRWSAVAFFTNYARSSRTIDRWKSRANDQTTLNKAARLSNR